MSGKSRMFTSRTSKQSPPPPTAAVLQKIDALYNNKPNGSCRTLSLDLHYQLKKQLLALIAKVNTKTKKLYHPRLEQEERESRQTRQTRQTMSRRRESHCKTSSSHSPKKTIKGRSRSRSRSRERPRLNSEDGITFKTNCLRQRLEELEQQQKEQITATSTESSCIAKSSMQSSNNNMITALDEMLSNLSVDDVEAANPETIRRILKLSAANI